MVSFTDRGVRYFDAFHPAWAVPPNRTINSDLLFFAVYGVVGNAVASFLLLSRPHPIAPRYIVLIMALLNLVVVLLFPPFEAFPWAGRTTVGSFDGFYFAFGDKSSRRIFMPLLTMEMIYVLLNACAFWLLMGMRERKREPTAGALTMLAQSDALQQQADALKGHADVLRRRAGEKLDKNKPGAGSIWLRGPDRRKRRDPSFKGPDRRRSGDRRTAR
ncbi:MAG: hypothetical protein EXR31_00510 [Betaproteobacteria bacterium]|nr:hypothetical protein [Betaproteobacteria bacterium]